MARLQQTSDGFQVVLGPWEKLGALRGHVAVRWDQVRRVTYRDRPRVELHGLRAPGTGVPGLVHLGTWRTLERKTFVASYRQEPGYVIDLEGHEFGRLIVTTEREAFLAARSPAAGGATP